MRYRFIARDIGPAIIIGLIAALGVLWAVFRPTEVPVGTYIGQFLGAQSILLLSIALVLISTLPRVEVWFDGIDRAAVWHRRAAILGVVLLLPHILLATGKDEAVGASLAVVGAVGVFTLALWAILPR